MATGQSILELANNAALTARIPLPPKVAIGLTVGEFYKLSVDVQTVSGQLLSKGAQRNARTRTLDVLFALTPSGPVLVGDLISAQLSINQSTTGFWVPIEALATGVRGLWTVFVVADLGTTQIEQRAVEIIYTAGNLAYITGAVADGEWLVVGGTHRFVPRQQVHATEQNLQLGQR